VTIARRSCGDKKLAKLGYGFAVVKPVRKGAKRERLDLGPGFLRRGSVGHDTRQVRDFGNPTAVVLLLKLNSQHVVSSVCGLSSAVLSVVNIYHNGLLLCRNHFGWQEKEMVWMAPAPGGKKVGKVPGCRSNHEFLTISDRIIPLI